jgi:peptide/nickel transport system ATP-binding protein
LAVAYRNQNVWLEAVRDFRLAVEPGQVYGLVGESGSGKTTLAMAVMRYLGKNGRVTGGRILFDGHDLLELSDREMRHYWGLQISLVPQDPMSALNPSIRVGEQIEEILHRRQPQGQTSIRELALQSLAEVRLPDVARVAGSYPHQISGGMQQRVMIAMAMCTDPRLLILDEPTTNLDVTTQATILDLIRDLIQESGAAVLYITHNLGIVAQICDRVAVLYAGELVEDAPIQTLFQRPVHPYTQGLLDSIPTLGADKNIQQLKSIPGSIPILGGRPPGCVFAPRCPLVIPDCERRPNLESSGEGHFFRCHRWREIAAGELLVDFTSSQIKPPSVTQQETSPFETGPSIQEVLGLRQVSVQYDIPRNIADILGRTAPPTLKAVDQVDLSIHLGVAVGLVGESGSGKTSLARAVTGLIEHSDGEMELLGFPLPANISQRDLETLRRLQMVFQNPDDALNPYSSVGAMLRRPLERLLKLSPQDADRQVRKFLSMVSLPEDYVARKPKQLSGGEKQRVAIARAFATSPYLLIADEPVSALDVSVQASILNLLNELGSEQATAMLFISHDLSVVGYIADLIAVLYRGQVVEYVRGADIYQPPYHPYTEALLLAIPAPDPKLHRERIRLPEEIQEHLDQPSGCYFYSRCPRRLGEICREVDPPWQASGSDARIRCHIPLEQLLQVPAVTQMES